MKVENCTQEKAVLEAAGSGRWPEDLKHHLDRCPECADALLVDTFLRHETVAETVERPLPDPGLIWQRARHHARQRDLRRAFRPIEVVETIAGACGTAVALGALVWVWPTISGWFAGLRPSLPEPSLALLPGAASLMVLGALLAMGTLAAEVYATWSES